MRYLGGKSKIAGHIARFLAPYVRNSSGYYEPFVGSAAIMEKVRHKNRHASDLCQPIITLHKSIADGWQPPMTVSKEDFERYKELRDPNDPMTAFVGFGMVFGGDFFHAIAKGHKGEDFARAARRSLLAARRSLLAARRSLLGVKWFCQDYRNTPQCKDWVIYCDPPYEGTTAYGSVGPFRHDVFWDWVRTRSKENLVFVSEYTAPNDFKVVWSRGHKTGLRIKGGGRG